MLITFYCYKYKYLKKAVYAMQRDKKASSSFKDGFWLLSTMKFSVFSDLNKTAENSKRVYIELH